MTLVQQAGVSFVDVAIHRFLCSRSRYLRRLADYASLIRPAS
jgi:hypothetical protein